MNKGEQVFTAVGWEARTKEGDAAERGSIGAYGNVCVQGKARGMGTTHNHIATEEKNLEELPFKISLT